MSTIKKMLFMALLVGVMGLSFATSIALASHNDANRVNCRLGDSHTWSKLGGDPVWSGGVNTVAQLGVIVRSAAGQRSLVCLGLNQAERAAITKQITQAKPCVLKQGQKVLAMAFHSDGASVDRPTKFADPRYPNGAPAFCLDAKIKQGKSTTTIRMLWPKKCVNASLLGKRTSRAPVKPVKPAAPGKKTTPPPAGSCNIVINNSTVTGNLTNCSTVTITVVCGNLSQTFQGSDQNKITQQAKDWQQANCNSTPPPPVVPPVVPPPVVPPATCQDHSATNYGGALPCTYPPPPPAKGRLIVQKQANASGTFQFSANGVLNTNFTLQTGGSVSYDVSPGSVNVSETCPSGGDTWMWQCDGSKSANVTSGQTVTLTFTNTAVCRSGFNGTYPNCSSPPPPATPPSLSNLTLPQEVFSNGETYPNICVTASGKNGNSLTVTFGSTYGSFSGGSTFTFTSVGVDRVCTTYRAPNTPDANGRTETITANIHDNTTGLNGSPVSSSFPIIASPVRP